jgi:hypothetical protein
MGEARGLLIGRRHLRYVVDFGLDSAALQVLLEYARTVALFAYVATLFVVQSPGAPWHEAFFRCRPWAAMTGR